MALATIDFEPEEAVQIDFEPIDFEPVEETPPRGMGNLKLAERAIDFEADPPSLQPSTPRLATPNQLEQMPRMAVVEEPGVTKDRMEAQKRADVEARTIEADLLTKRFGMAMELTGDPQKRERLKADYDRELRKLGVEPLGEGPGLKAALLEPPTSLPRVSSEDMEVLFPGSKTAQVVAGVQRGVAGLGEGMLAPAGLIAGVAAPKAAAGYFGVEAVRHTPEIAQAAGTASVEGTAGEQAEAFTGLVINSVLAPSLIKHAVAKKIPAVELAKQLERAPLDTNLILDKSGQPLVLEAVAQNLEMAKAPATAAALRQVQEKNFVGQPEGATVKESLQVAPVVKESFTTEPNAKTGRSESNEKTNEEKGRQEIAPEQSAAPLDVEGMVRPTRNGRIERGVKPSGGRDGGTYDRFSSEFGRIEFDESLANERPVEYPMIDWSSAHTPGTGKTLYLQALHALKENGQKGLSTQSGATQRAKGVIASLERRDLIKKTLDWSENRGEDGIFEIYKIEITKEGERFLTGDKPPVPVAVEEGAEYVVYQGRGRAEKGSVYSAGIDRPIFGEGEYYALTPEKAAKYGPSIKEHKVRLKNPLIVGNDSGYRELIKGAGIRYPKFWQTAPSEIPAALADASAKIEAYLKANGYDGVIVKNLDKPTMDNALLGEAFGHDQIFVPKGKVRGDGPKPEIKTEPVDFYTEVEKPETLKSVEQALRFSKVTEDKIPDLVQSVLEKALRRQQEGNGWEQGKGSVQGYLDQMARNHSIDSLRVENAAKRGGKIERISLDEEPMEGSKSLKGTLPSEEALPTQTAAATEARSILQKAMEGFNEAERRVLRMIENGEETKAVGRELGMNSKQLLQLRDSVLAKLQSSLADVGIRSTSEVLGAVQQASMQTALAPAVKGGVSIPQVFKAFEDVIEASGGRSPIRFGRFFQRALGIYKPHSEVIRLKSADDIPTGAHEMGHALQKQLYKSAQSTALKGLPPVVKAELVAMGRALYGTRRPAAGYTAEGFAEFTRKYLTTDNFRTVAPATSRYFDSMLKSDPVVGKAMAGARKSVDTWRQQGPEMRAKMQLDAGETLRERVGKRIDDIISKEKQVEEFEPLRKLVEASGKMLSPGNDPFLTASWKRGASGAVVERMVENGMMDIAGNVVGPGLKEALAPIKGRKEDFTLYLWARRAVERWQRGKNPGLSLEDAQALIQKFETPEFQLAADKVYEWQRGLLDYMVQANPSFAPVVAAIQKASADYVPLARMFSEKELKPTAKDLAQRSNPMFHMTGSGRKVRDIFPVMLENATMLVSMAHKRLVLDQIFKLANQAEGLGWLIEEVPLDRAKVEFNFEKIRNELEAMGVDTSAVAPDEIMSFFATAKAPKGNEPIIPFKTATGETKWYFVDPEIYGVLNGMDLPRLPWALDMVFGMPARAFRMGTTGLRASFSLFTNPVRDFETLLMQTQSHKNPAQLAADYFGILPKVVADGLGANGGPHVEAFYNLAAHMAQPLGGDIRHTRRAARNLFRGKTMAVVNSPLEFLREVLSITEAAPRITELKALAEEVGWTPGQPMTFDQAVQLGLAAKRVTTDFTAAGSVGKWVNLSVPFYNATIQGHRSFLRALKANPAKAIMTGASIAMVPTLLNWWRNKDEDWYTNMPWRERYLYWNVGVGNHVMQIPKTQDWGNLFSVLPEAMMDALYRQNPEAAKAAMGHLIETANPADLPVLLKVGYEQARNRNSFFETPIVPRGQVDLPPGEQVGPYTTGTAKMLGNMAPETISPRRVDAAVRGIGGGAAIDALRTVDKVAGTAATNERQAEPSDMAIFGRAFRYGGKFNEQSKPISEFWEDYTRLRAFSVSKERKLQGKDAAYWEQLKAAHERIKHLREKASKENLLAERQIIFQKMASVAKEVTGKKPR